MEIRGFSFGKYFLARSDLICRFSFFIHNTFDQIVFYNEQRFRRRLCWNIFYQTKYVKH